ncbi:MAG TPA: c-type cytochrome [Chitinophagaceae bacterium]|nr:c-type cytochrome [Chitinophagaceae bacterium]
MPRSMIFNKQIITILTLVVLVTGGMAAVNAPKEKYKNLKILPKDISEQKLDSIMDSYSKALGIGCNFCHVELKDFPDSLDYVSDANTMKENAREMMRMTILINKTYFHFDKNEKPEYLKVVNCKTCHRGEPYPEG